MSVRAGFWALGVVLALVVQVTVLPYLAVSGVVPNLALLVVVALALARGPEPAMIAGFLAGLLLDLAPPAAHLAGRWALALVAVGFVVGTMRGSTRAPLSRAALTLTAVLASLLATSVYALTGLLLGDLAAGVPDLLAVIAISALLDLLAAALVLPRLTGSLSRPEPHRVPL